MRAWLEQLRGTPPQAAAWAARRLAGRSRPSEDIEFNNWLRKRRENRDSYRQAAGILAEFDALALDHDAIQLLKGPPKSRPVAARIPWPAAAALTAACAAVAMSLYLAGAWPAAPAIVVETPRGAQKQIVLTDGSHITLNTLSRVRIAYTFAERRVWLEEGQADFRVAKDPRRPFRVFVGPYKVSALGTAFDLRRDGRTARVALREGRLALVNGAIGKKTVLLEAGYRAELRPSGDTVIARANLQREGVWRIGRIILDGDSLADAVKEFNRYNDEQLSVPHSAANYRVSGVFNLREPGAFAAAVSATLPVKITASPSSAPAIDAAR